MDCFEDWHKNPLEVSFLVAAEMTLSRPANRFPGRTLRTQTHKKSKQGGCPTCLEVQLKTAHFFEARKRRAPPKPRKLTPRRAKVAPPSGTRPADTVDDDQLNELSSEAAPWVVKNQVPGVGSSPAVVLVTVPDPEMLRKPGICKTIADDDRLKVNPPTDQRAGVGVDGLKIHGAVKATGVLAAKPA